MPRVSHLVLKGAAAPPTAHQHAVALILSVHPHLPCPYFICLLQFNARPNAVEQVLTAFKHALAKQGWKGAAADKSEL